MSALTSFVAWHHGVFLVFRQHRLLPAADEQYSWRVDVFIHRLWNNVYDRWITSNSPCNWHRTASTTSGCKSSPRTIFHRNSSGARTPTWNLSPAEKTTTRNRRVAEKTSLTTVKATSSTQRPQTCTDAATKYYNYCKRNRWREETPTADASKSDQEIRQRSKFTVKIIFFDATIGRKSHTRISFQRTEDSRSAFTPWAPMGFFSTRAALQVGQMGHLPHQLSTSGQLKITQVEIYFSRPSRNCRRLLPIHLLWSARSRN